MYANTFCRERCTYYDNPVGNEGMNGRDTEKMLRFFVQIS